MMDIAKVTKATPAGTRVHGKITLHATCYVHPGQEIMLWGEDKCPVCYKKLDGNTKEEEIRGVVLWDKLPRERDGKTEFGIPIFVTWRPTEKVDPHYHNWWEFAYNYPKWVPLSPNTKWDEFALILADLEDRPVRVSLLGECSESHTVVSADVVIFPGGDDEFWVRRDGNCWNEEILFLGARIYHPDRPVIYLLIVEQGDSFMLW